MITYLRERGKKKTLEQRERETPKYAAEEATGKGECINISKMIIYFVSNLHSLGIFVDLGRRVTW